MKDIPGFAQANAVPSLVIGIQANLILFNSETGPSSVVSSVFPMLSISSPSAVHINSGLSDLRNGNRKPKLPIEKLNTGGHSPSPNRCDTCSIVPSPPKVMTMFECKDSNPSSPGWHSIQSEVSSG